MNGILNNMGETCRCEETDLDALSDELQSLKNRVQSLSLQLISKNKALNALRDTLKEILVSESYNLLPSIIRDLNKEISFEKEWLTLEDNYDYITKGFIQKLSLQFPNLSQAEIRICILIRQGLKSKEMADILHLSKHTIDAHRKSIRRKIKAPQEIDLDGLLKDL